MDASSWLAITLKLYSLTLKLYSLNLKLNSLRFKGVDFSGFVSPELKALLGCWWREGNASKQGM